MMGLRRPSPPAIRYRPSGSPEVTTESGQEIGGVTDHISYPPLNTPKQVAEGVWIVDAEPVHPGGIPLERLTERHPER